MNNQKKDTKTKNNSTEKLLIDTKPSKKNISSYIESLLASEVIRPFITYHKVFSPSTATFSETVRPWTQAMKDILESSGISSLYAHQAQAINAIRAGKNIVVSTPTASGKSLIYTLPTIEQFLYDNELKSLFLFPLKALAQDQLASFNALTQHWPKEARPQAAVYDGDTTPHFRKKIRERLPAVLFTNPEMLHLSLLPHHHLWTTLFAGLSLIVVDEVHTYRGLLGAHMAQVFRRLLRIANLYGANPTFVFCSATIGNPVELTEKLTGITPVPILESTAPQGKKHFIFINPDESPASTAIKLLKLSLKSNLRTIIYCQSRKMTELISLWASQDAGKFSKKISAYRAGYLPEERRDIEQKMASGELLAVVTTSALELGIDIGTLDVCILVGYPGTVMATLQRGGRVGRGKQESVIILIAQEDALDQYIVRHPEDFFSRTAETAIVNPNNPVILSKHLECAAAELSLRPEQPLDSQWLKGEATTVLLSLEAQGRLLRSADGKEVFATRKRPHHETSLRGSGNTVSIVDENNTLIGNVDGIRALREAHPGSIYLHHGAYYEITHLDISAGLAKARKFKPPWYTRTRSNKDTEIIHIEKSRIVQGIAIQFGTVKIIDTVTGYEKRAIKNGQLLAVVPLELPPQTFQTEGFWFMIPTRVRVAVEANYMHFMGAIHALEHATIGLLPLLVMADRNDLGGISKPIHIQTGKPTIFIYDGMPGGAGLTREAFHKSHELFQKIQNLIFECPCELGCPSCVHSPKCGSGNRPIDKAGALFLMNSMLLDDPTDNKEAEKIIPLITSAINSREKEALLSDSNVATTEEERIKASISPKLLSDEKITPQNGTIMTTDLNKNTQKTTINCNNSNHFVVLDVETRYSALEVGGWHRANKMGVSVAVLYDSLTDTFTSYNQENIPELAERLEQSPLVVGFNIIKFDYSVLAPHAPACNFRNLNTLDMLVCIYEQLNYRVSLDNLATATLGATKTATGLQALQWWKEQRLDLIETYCRQDVALTRDLYTYGKDNGYLLFTNKAKKSVRVRASWSTLEKQ